MACCAALALVLGVLRAGWFRVLPGRRPPEPGFAPPARRSADGLAPTASSPVPIDRPPRPGVAGSLALGTAWGTAAYAVVVATLAATPLVRTLDGPWLARDVALIALAAGALAAGLSLGPGSRPATLVGAGVAWTELGLLDMHLLGLFDFRLAALPLDLLLHGGGLVVALIAAGHLVPSRTNPRASTA